MAISRMQLVKELEPGLNALFGLEYDRYENQDKEIFDSESSDRAFEEEVMLGGFANAAVKPEGQGVSYEDAQETYTARYTNETIALAFALIENHYFVNKGFLDNENQLLDNVDLIRHIPAVIIQGRYDVVCPPSTAYELSSRWPEAKLKIAPFSGHSAFESEITKMLVEAKFNVENEQKLINCYNGIMSI